MRFFSGLKTLSQASLLVCTLGSLQASATVVQFQTVMGNIEVNLFDKTTPKTVANFLTYVKAGSYSNSIIHRSVPGFIIQGGGYSYSGSMPLSTVAQNAAVVNEPTISNKRGTISMAKLSGNVNSATNQWFINLADNSSNLDLQNGGFTAFGQVTAEGMIVADAIAKLYIASVDIGDVPLRNYTATDFTANKAPNADNLVLITAVTIKDATIDTAATLSPAPTPNTLLGSSSSSSGSSGGKSGGGGGSTGYVILMALAAFIGLNGLIRKQK